MYLKTTAFCLLSKIHGYDYVILRLDMTFVFKVALKVPVIVRLEGTNVDQGKRILKVNLQNRRRYSFFSPITKGSALFYTLTEMSNQILCDC